MSKPSGSAIQRVGMIFAGGPAPAANAVITAAASALRRSGREVIGFKHGYSALQEFDAATRPLVEGEDYFLVQDRHLQGLRNSRGILIGTARANPGKGITRPADLADASKTMRLKQVTEGLRSLGVDALISIGGDDTLKTANLFHLYQAANTAEGERKVRVIHVPKTIDNDYRGIDFTFGFFTAVDVMAKELLNLRADALATRSYFIVETMGRKAGWLAYGVAIAGEAHMVIGVEDVKGAIAVERQDGVAELDLHKLADRIVDLILARRARGKHYGTVVLAEGLAEMLPDEQLENVPRDEHGHVSLGKIDLGKLVAQVTADRFKERTGETQKLTGVQLGYESRCAAPHAFDVMLGSQLGLGAFRALVEEDLDGHMVSVGGQLDLSYVPFEQLIDPSSLRTEVRFIQPGSDFHRLAMQLGTQLPRV